jgi:hypothetical protein
MLRRRHYQYQFEAPADSRGIAISHLRRKTAERRPGVSSAGFRVYLQIAVTASWVSPAEKKPGFLMLLPKNLRSLS